MSSMYNITPEMFQAVGDGIKDDSMAIQTALNSCVISEEDELFETLVFSGEKKYFINAPIEVPYGVSVDFSNATIIVGEKIVDFCIYVNSNPKNGSIRRKNPNRTQVLKNLNLTTMREPVTGVYSKDKNGIFMAGKGVIEAVFSCYINKVIYCTDEFVEEIQVRDVQCMYRWGDEYAIYMGSCGMNRMVSNVLQAEYSNAKKQGYQGRGIPLTVDTGVNHQHVDISKIVHGSINVRSNAILSEIVLANKEELFIDRCSAIVTNFSSQYRGIPTIIINSYDPQTGSLAKQQSHVVIDQAEFFISGEREQQYVRDEQHNYLDGKCIDIDRLGNGSLEIGNVFISYGETSGSDRVICPVTLSDSTPLARALSQYYEIICAYHPHVVLAKKELKSRDIIPDSEKEQNGFTYGWSSQHFKQWHGRGGKFYYKICFLLDGKRNLLAYDSRTQTITTDGTKSIIIRTQLRFGLIRVYRGEQPEKYTKYVDIPLEHENFLVDDNVRVNGRMWKNFEGELPASCRIPRMYKIIPTEITQEGLSYILKAVNVQKWDESVAVNGDSVELWNDNYTLVYTMWNGAWRKARSGDMESSAW